MLKIYGSMLCRDCVACVKELREANVEFEFLDFADSLLNLKEFLAIRDCSAVFADARKEGYIGIPCILDEKGIVHLSWDSYVSQADA